jgi:type VI secretion system protein ImpL
MLAIFKNKWFLALIGLLFLALIIWFGGPYIAIAEVKPLEGATGRLIAIIIVMVIYALIVTLKQLRSKKASQKLAAGAAKQE